MDETNSRYKLLYEHSDGYRLFHDESHHRASRKRVLGHIIIYEEFYRCCILKSSVVHHKDGNKINNNIENLQLMSKSEHIRHHKLEKRKDIDYSLVGCMDCGTTTVPIQTRKSGYKYPYWHPIDILKKLFRCHKCYQRHYRNDRK